MIYKKIRKKMTDQEKKQKLLEDKFDRRLAYNRQFSSWIYERGPLTGGVGKENEDFMDAFNEMYKTIRNEITTSKKTPAKVNNTAIAIGALGKYVLLMFVALPCVLLLLALIATWSLS